MNIKTFLLNFFSQLNKLLLKELNQVNQINLLFKNYSYSSFYIRNFKELPLLNNLKFLVKVKNIKIFSLFYLNLLVNSVKWVVIPSIISLFYFYVSLYYIQVDFTKQFAAYFILLILYYLLISTFNSFLIKYRFGKFTSAIQRFWKRTGMIFWLLEGFLFIIFFYYFLNSSQEPIYMFDYSSLNQESLIQLKVSFKNLLLLSLAIYLCFLLTINNNFLNYYQNIVILLFISIIIFYMLFIESYQFSYTINMLATKNWLYDENTHSWVLEVEQQNHRVKQYYFLLCLVAKYWHFIFIFISWFFFLIKTVEISKLNYTLLSYNKQNLIILYVLNLCCIVQWLKILFKKFLEVTYYWFHIQYDEKFSVNFINEMTLILKSLVVINVNPLAINLKTMSSVLYFSNDLFLWKYL